MDRREEVVFGGGERVVVRKLVPAFAGPTVGV